jgi:hypothetical protein
VAKWRIGEPPLPFGRVAWQAEIRWRQPTASTPLLVATAKGRGLVGGTAPRRALRARELNHDLLLTAAYLQLNRAEPAAAAAWVGEDTLAFHAACQDSPQRPDALLVGLRPVAIECIGRYDARKLRRLHDCYAEQFGAYWFY